MTFEESISVIKSNMREGDAKQVADQLGCTKPVVFNALAKGSLADMSLLEKKAFDSLLKLLIDRNESERKIQETAINLAQSLQK